MITPDLADISGKSGSWCMSPSVRVECQTLSGPRTAPPGHAPLLDGQVVKLLREYMNPLRDFICNLIKIELAYINTNHPHFYGGGSVFEQMTPQMVAPPGPGGHPEHAPIGPGDKTPRLGSSNFTDMPSHIRQDIRHMTERQKRETEVIKQLLTTYFGIIQISIQVSVPCALIPSDVLERPYTVGGGEVPSPGPSPLLPVQCLRLTAKNLLRRLRCQEDFSTKILARPQAGRVGPGGLPGGPVECSPVRRRRLHVTVLGLNGGTPSDCPWDIRLAYAEALGAHCPDMYVPAQHGTGWDNLLSRLQAAAHGLAAQGLQGARTETYPFPGVLDGCTPAAAWSRRSQRCWTTRTRARWRPLGSPRAGRHGGHSRVDRCQESAVVGHQSREGEMVGEGAGGGGGERESRAQCSCGDPPPTPRPCERGPMR